MAIETSTYWAYSSDTHRYTLTLDGVLNLRGLDVMIEGQFETTTDAGFFLEKVSRDIYNYIYNLLPANTGFDKYTKRKNVLEYFVFRNRDEELDYLIDAMLDQVEYSIQSGGDLMINEFQLNDQLLASTDKIALWISPVARHTLKQSVLGFPGRITFRIPKEEYRNGY